MRTVNSDEALGYLPHHSFSSRREEHVVWTLALWTIFSGLLFRLSMDIVCRRTRQSEHLDLPSIRLEGTKEIFFIVAI